MKRPTLSHESKHAGAHWRDSCSLVIISEDNARALGPCLSSAVPVRNRDRERDKAGARARARARDRDRDKTDSDRQRHTLVVRGSKARHVRGSTDVEGPLGCSLATVSVERAAGAQGSPVGTPESIHHEQCGAHLPRLRRCIVAVHATSFAHVFKSRRVP